MSNGNCRFGAIIGRTAMERIAWKGRMDLSRIYTKTSKGILEGNAKTRALTREHGRVLVLIDGKSSLNDILEKSTRLSQSRLAAILDELVAEQLSRRWGQPVIVENKPGGNGVVAFNATQRVPQRRMGTN